MVTPTTPQAKQPRVVDLFAGPGGWDVAAKSLGLDPLGIEHDDAACKTREAAGLRTLQANVASLDPLDFAPCDLLIGSPPCQAFSTAGKQEGEKDKPAIFQCARALDTMGAWPEREWNDARSPLVLEPLRWALALMPGLIVLEQVPPVLELWENFAEILRGRGYSVWTGVLSAERFGVPQTRKRAILMASTAGPVEPPRPTHQAYVSGEAARHEVTLEGEVLPWVSMAEALGWRDADQVAMRSNFPGGKGGNIPSRAPAPAPAITGVTGSMEWERVDVPAPTVTGGGTANGGPEPFGRGGAYSDLPRYRRTRGPGMTERHGERRAHPADEPAPSITSKARSDEWEYDTRQTGAIPRGGNTRPNDSWPKGWRRDVT